MHRKEDINLHSEENLKQVKKKWKRFSIKKNPFKKSVNRSYDSTDKCVEEKCSALKLQAGLEENLKTSDLGESIPSTPVSNFSESEEHERKNDDETSLEVKGISGIANLGNSCYMNSIIQCIAHIDVLSEYFALDIFLHDINVNETLRKRNKKNIDNRDNSVTYKVSDVVKSLWGNQPYNIRLIQDLLELIEKLNSDYRGRHQQDAHEFLMWMIGKIHEETQKSSTRKLKDFKKKKHHTEDEQAVVAFASYTNYCQSYTQGLFLSQYRSTITCLKCNKASSTFDPFTCVSLPIPQKASQQVYINVVFSDKKTTPVKLGFTLKKSLKISEVIEQVQSNFHQLGHVILVDISLTGTPRILKPDDVVGCLSKNEISVYCVELDNGLPEFNNNELGMDDTYLTLIISHVEAWGSEHRRFGTPVALHISTSSSFKDILTAVRKGLPNNIRDPLHKVIKEHGLKLGLRIIHPFLNNQKEFLRNEHKYPLQHAVPESAIIYNLRNRKRLLYLVAEWEPVQHGGYMARVGISLPIEDESCREIRQLYSEEEVTDLDACLKLQTQEEKLEDRWKCPFCGKEQLNVTKKLTLWSLPDILVFHFKRFDQLHNEKLSTLVTFPVNELNMSSHVATTKISKWSKKKYQRESVRLNYHRPPTTEKECMYDLKAVCNHLGTKINKGHYTTSCLNSMSNSWYLFDDRNVKPISDSDVVTSDAYLLFYQRRQLSSRIPDQIYLSLTKSIDCEDHHWAHDIKAETVLGVFR